MPERLRIAQLAPVATPVARDAPDSIGQLVWLLTDDLVAKGHDVTLFATGDSQTSARLETAYARGYEADGALWDWQFHEVMHAAGLFERAGEFDVIHSHAYHYALPFTRLVDTPVVHTYHVGMDPDIAALYARHRETHLVAISDYQRRTLIGREDAPVIHHGIDLAAFDFNARGGDYLAFLGRMIPEKGPHEAIAVARAAGLPLVLAGPAEDESGWFGAVVAPQVDDVQVRYVGPVGAKDRNTILAGAAALVYPVCDPEPFGLVMVEAMACGTPVVATNVGAVPEIVRDGVTGFVADPAGLADRIGAAAALDRATVRRWAVARFDHHRMADDYEALYRALAAGRR